MSAKGKKAAAIDVATDALKNTHLEVSPSKLTSAQRRILKQREKRMKEMEREGIDAKKIPAFDDDEAWEKLGLGMNSVASPMSTSAESAASRLRSESSGSEISAVSSAHPRSDSIDAFAAHPRCSMTFAGTASFGGLPYCLADEATSKDIRVKDRDMLKLSIVLTPEVTAYLYFQEGAKKPTDGQVNELQAAFLQKTLESGDVAFCRMLLQGGTDDVILNAINAHEQGTHKRIRDLADNAFAFRNVEWRVKTGYIGFK